MWLRTMIERRALVLLLRVRDCAPNRGEVIDVGDVLDMPAVGLEALALVLRIEGERRRPVDGDAIVVVEEDELAEPERAGERRGLLRDALHEIAVGGDAVDVVVDDRVAGPVVALQRETSPPSPCRPRSRSPARVGPVVVSIPGVRKCSGWPGVERLPLAEALDLLEREVVARQVERRVLEDAGVARGEDEAVAVLPVGIRRVRTHDVAVEDVGHRSERHRRPRMASVGLLDGVHGQRADRVDR